MYSHSRHIMPIPLNDTIQHCIDNIMDHYLETETRCHCPIGCKETMFEVSATQAQWPTQATLPHWVKKAQAVPGKHNVTADYVRNNYVAIQVYYKDFLVATTTHQPAYDLNSFLSDLGGQLGLWIGASVYSIIEIFSFVFELILYHVILKGKLKRKEEAKQELPSYKVTNQEGEELFETKMAFLDSYKIIERYNNSPKFSNT